MKKVAVFPASGRLGSATRSALCDLLPPQQLVLISRHPEKIPEDLVKAGVETRKADYDAPETLKDAFNASKSNTASGYEFRVAERLNVEISSLTYTVKAHQEAVTAALESTPGIEHVFYTSLGYGGDGESHSAAYVMQAHLRTEAWLREVATSREGRKTPTFTVIREGIYSETWPMYTSFFDPKASNSKAQLPHDGSGPGIAWACIKDLGEATAKLVKEYVDDPTNPRYINKIVVLTGPKDWSLKETVEVLGRLGAGGGASIEQVSVDEHAQNPRVVQKIGSHGPGNSVPRDWTTVFEAIRNGETAVVNGELERLLGRPPESFDETAERMLAN